MGTWLLRDILLYDLLILEIGVKIYNISVLGPESPLTGILNTRSITSFAVSVPDVTVIMGPV